MFLYLLREVKTMKNLAYWRAVKKFQVRTLASKANVSTNTITRIEAGEKTTTVTLGKLAEALGIDVTQLAEWEQTTNQPPKIIKIEAALLAELEASDADGVEFSEAESELDTDAFLDRLESQSKRLVGAGTR